jgi:hypothetical protein
MTDAPKPKQKLYCYVDETGQDSEGRLFLVAVLILGDDRDDLRRAVLGIEQRTGKREKKWSRSTPRQRAAYIQSILDYPSLAGRLYYSAYQETHLYVDLTILSVAKAINTHTPRPYAATILVDGLQRSEQRRFARGLRKLRISARKVRGLTDQADVFICLADSLAGFVRDGRAKDEHLEGLYVQAMRDKAVSRGVKKPPVTGGFFDQPPFKVEQPRSAVSGSHQPRLSPCRT